MSDNNSNRSFDLNLLSEEAKALLANEDLTALTVQDMLALLTGEDRKVYAKWAVAADRVVDEHVLEVNGVSIKVDDGTQTAEAFAGGELSLKEFLEIGTKGMFKAYIKATTNQGTRKAPANSGPAAMPVLDAKAKGERLAWLLKKSDLALSDEALAWLRTNYQAITVWRYAGKTVALHIDPEFYRANRGACRQFLKDLGVMEARTATSGSKFLMYF